MPHSGADPGFVERGGAAAVPFEDPLWNFKRGGCAPPAAPPLNPLVTFEYFCLKYTLIV